MAEMIHSKDAQEKCGENIQRPNDNHQRTRLAGMYSTTVCLTSKAALLTLYWSFFIGIHYELSSNLNEVWFPIFNLEFISLVYIVSAISLCFYPLAGYLADNKIGKHKMISRSLQLLIIALVVAILINIVFGLVIWSALLLNNMDWVVVTSLVGVMILAGLFYIAKSVGFVGFTVIQFGMEQLHDSPTNHQSLYAQSPPSMKGLLIGLSFAIKGVFQAIGAAFIIPFSYIPTSIPSCGVLYYGINVFLAIFALIIFTYVARKYQYRQRDEICDVYRYAEEYYSNKQEEHNYD